MAILLRLWGAEGWRDLYVSLIQGDLFSFKVWFLIQHPARGRKRRFTPHMWPFLLAYLLLSNSNNNVCQYYLLYILTSTFMCLCFGHKNVEILQKENSSWSFYGSKRSEKLVLLSYLANTNVAPPHIHTYRHKQTHSLSCFLHSPRVIYTLSLLTPAGFW